MAQMHHQIQSGPPPPQQVAGTSQMTPVSSQSMNASYRENQSLLVYIIDYCKKRKYNAAAEVLKQELDENHANEPPIDSPDGFLFEWWSCFWQVYTARLTPEKNFSKAAKEYSDFYNRHGTGNQIDSRPDLPPNARPAGHLQRPYANGISPHPPPTANGHGPPNQYPVANPAINGAQHTPVATPGIPGNNPNLYNNPNLQHLRQGGPVMNNLSLGMHNSVPPGGLPQQRVLNGNPTQGNQGTRPPVNPVMNGPVPQQPQGSQNSDSQSSNAGGNSRPLTGPNATDAPQQSQDPTRQENYAAAATSRAAEDSKKTSRITRGAMKRPSPSEEDTGSKDSSPRERKKQKRSPESHPPTPSLPARVPAPPANGPAAGKPASGTFPQQAVPTATTNANPEALNGIPTGTPGQPSVAIGRQLLQLQQTEKTHTNNQQFLSHLQQAAAAGYNGRLIQSPNPNPMGTANTVPSAGLDPSAAGGRVSGRSARPMLPPPLPNATQPQGLNTTANTKTTPVMSGLTVQNGNGSSPGDPSPEVNRPGSRPTAGSTPQAIPSASTPNAMLAGSVSTPGAPSSMSVPSPTQLPTPQQTVRGQSQSPHSAPRAPAANGNGIQTGPPAMNPQALLNRSYSLSNGNVDGIMSNTSMMALSQTITPGSIINSALMSDPMNGTDPGADPLFGLGTPFDLGMMNFPDTVIDFEHVYSSFIDDGDILPGGAGDFMQGS